MFRIFIASILFVSLASGWPKPGHKPQEVSDDERKLINTPIICKNGEEADAYGNCKNVEKRSAPEVSIVPECLIDCTIPGRDCPEGQEMDENGNCRDTWGRKKREAEQEASPVEPECIIGCNIPDRCPDGQKPDQNGNCRDEWGLREEEKDRKDHEESSLIRALKPKKTDKVSKKRNDDDSTSKPEGKSVKIKVAKAKVAKAKVVKGKTFILLKKKKKVMMRPTTEAPEDPEPQFPPDNPFPFPMPEPLPPGDDEELSVESCESGECEPVEEKRKLKTIDAADTWENWFDDSEEEEEDSSEEEESEDVWETEEIVEEPPGPEEIDEELLEQLIEAKVMTLMQMLEMKRRYGPLIAQMMTEEIQEEEEKRMRKRNKKKRS